MSRRSFEDESGRQRTYKVRVFGCLPQLQNSREGQGQGFMLLVSLLLLVAVASADAAAVVVSNEN